MARAELEPFQRELDVDVLSPLYHLPLVRFLLTLPHEIRRGVVGDRQLQRRSMAGRFPAGVVERLTKGSSHRLVGLQYTESDAWYDAMHDDPVLIKRGWVIADEWLSEVDRVRVGAAQCGPAMIWAMETELWLRSLEEFGWPAAVEVAEPT